MSLKDTIKFFAERLRNEEIYPKIASMTDYIVQNAETDFQDVIAKYTDPGNASDDVIDRVIDEFGFSYINDIVDTITGIEKNILFQFLSLLHLLKGSRIGLQLVLEILGFEATIVEWWEESPKAEPDTFKIDIVFNLSQVSDVFLTLDRIRTFVIQYVYPKLIQTNINVDIEFAQGDTAVAGFFLEEKNGLIEDTLVI